jgi:hypothetical protein
MDDKFFEDARDMFITEGWKTFIKDVEANIINLRIENLEDEKAFWMAKGQLAVLHQIAGYENMVYHAEQEEDNASDS